MVSKFAPKNWSILCWLQIAVWAAFGLWANLPVSAPIFPQDLSDQLPRRYAAYDPELAVGWPIPFLEMKLTGKLTQTVHQRPLFANVVLILATLAAIPIFHVKYLKQFSIKLLLLVTGVAALLLALAMTATRIESSNLVATMILAIYLSPMLLVIGHATWGVCNHRPKSQNDK